MRVSGMLRRTSASVIVIAPVFALVLVAHANALPLRNLPDIPGYIPVYIRFGEQPLDEINPNLAEAFHESTGTLNSIQEIPFHDLTLENFNKDLTNRKYNSLNSKEENTFYKADNLSFNINRLIVSNTPREEKSFSQTSKLPKFLTMKVSKFLPLKKNNFKKIIQEIKQKD